MLNGVDPVGPDLGPNCMQKVISRRQNSPLARKELKHTVSFTLDVTHSFFSVFIVRPISTNL